MEQKQLQDNNSTCMEYICIILLLIFMVTL